MAEVPALLLAAGSSTRMRESKQLLPLEGMGTSISYAIGQIINTLPEEKGVLIALVDQPLVTTSYFQKMFECFTPGKSQILVSQSDSGWIGVPALFDKYYYKYLLELSNDEGAKKVINRFKEKVTVVRYNDPLEDIGTPQAY